MTLFRVSHEIIAHEQGFVKPEFQGFAIKLSGNQFHKPEMEPKLRAVKGITEEMEKKFASHRTMPYRVQTIAVHLLMEHAVFCRGIAEAKDFYFSFMEEFGARELWMERYYDHFMPTHSLKMIFNTKSEYDQ